MDFEKEALLSFYKDMAPVKGHSDVILTQHVETGRLFVKKTLSIYDRELYSALQKMHLYGIPEIQLIAEDGENLIVIEEYINGSTLDSFMRENGLFDENSAAYIMRQLCDILEPLHNAVPPVIHRDIKPSNIMIDRDLNVTLIDFNAAKRFDAEKDRDTVLMGTADYAAPEQYGFAQSDARTDIYALGILFNIMLTGESPKSHLYEGHLSGIISRCTSIDPEDRYPSVKKLRKALGSGHGTSAGFALPGFRSRRPWKMITAAAVYLLVLYTSFTMQVEGVDSAPILAIYRLATLAMFMSAIFVFCDYRDVCSRLPLLRGRDIKTSVSKLLLWACISGFIVLCIGAAVIALAEYMLTV